MMKSLKGLTWLIVVLFLLVIFLISLVIYKGFFVDTDLKIESESTTTNTTTTIKKQTLSDKEIEKYLSYVPFSLLHKDAYDAQNVNIDTINKAALLFSVYHIDGLEMTVNNENDICSNEGCILENDFNIMLKNMYNIGIDDFNGEYDEVEEWLNYETYLILKDDYYFELGYGGSKKKSDEMNVSYEINNDELIINEQIGIIVEHTGDVTVYNGGKSVQLYSFRGDDETENPNYKQQAENYVKENLNDFNTYKHIFKQHEDGTYYWYSTEIVEDN